MKYYKIILDNSFIGAIHSGLFVAENKTGQKLLYSDETRGQYVSYNGILYHDYWMKPINGNKEFVQANIIEITEEEYNIYMKAIENNQPIEDEIEEEIPIVVPIPETPIDVEYIKESKLNEMSRVCRTTIEEGFDIELRGETKHFSLDTQDQLNLMSLGQMTQTMSLIPYHADGEACDFYVAEEIEQIISAANAYKIYHTTYYNSLKAYINSLETIQDIAAVTYGMDIPEEYQTDVLKALNGGN